MLVCLKEVEVIGFLGCGFRIGVADGGVVAVAGSVDVASIQGFEAPGWTAQCGSRLGTQLLVIWS